MNHISKSGQLQEINIGGNCTFRYLKAGAGEPLILMHAIRTQLREKWS